MQKSGRFAIGRLQETSKLFNPSLALPIFTTISSRTIPKRSVHSPVSSRKIPDSHSMRKLLVYDSGKHPIAFDSRKRIPAELNYEIHDKELLGIFWALKHWRAFLLSLSSPFEVLTNHSSLQYFMSSKVLTCHQARWAEFHFSITYCPGRLATLPDALSHWDNQDEVQPSRYFAVKVECFSNLIDSIQKKLWQDPQYRSILEELGKGKSIQHYSLDSSSQLLLFKDRVVVPNDPTIQLSILQKRHDSPLAGHPVQEKTLKPVKWDFHLSGMTQCIKDYVSSCQQCSRNKNIHHQKFRLLKTLPIPNGPWICLSMDFITQLPLSNSFDSILVIVDRFSKMAVFIPTMSSITSLDLAHLFIKNIFSKHGLPSRIIERVYQILEQYLWMYFSYHQHDWNTWLPLAEFAYNNSNQSSAKQSPFFTVYGRDPQFDSVHITQDNCTGKLSTKAQSAQQEAKRELEVAIKWFKRYADKIRASPPDFNPGEMKVSTHDYQLKLPSQWKSIHPVFHISLLEPVKTSKIANQNQEPPPPIIIEEEEEWELSQILHSKLKRGKLWYVVEWKGFSQDSERSTCQPTENLKNFTELVKDFHSFYTEKPGPNSSKA
ncbi:hypothetical protein O181_046882 [Austropuccinia psidii MF-1]|uniref:Chromo domain-containing protein n=1 Tax=Austropuccinia psidii MF-1 TaxID=1389203 RepID=A0A9Q3DWS8_9BASI|nr:hypothetical protein [Austropuccinia psidii MF-1]